LQILVINPGYFLLSSFVIAIPEIALYIMHKPSRNPNFRLKNSKLPGSIKHIAGFFENLGLIIGFIDLYIVLCTFLIYPQPQGFNAADIFRLCLLTYFGIRFSVRPLLCPDKLGLIKWISILITAVLTFTVFIRFMGHLSIYFPAPMVVVYLIFEIPASILDITKVRDKKNRNLWDISEKINRYIPWRINLILFVLLGFEWVLWFFGRSLFCPSV